MARARWLIVGSVLMAAVPALAQDNNSLVSEAMPPDAVIDEGSLVISGPTGFSRTEDFLIFKRPDGGYSILSNIAADDDSYQATATWTYDSQWRATGASARSVTKGVERKIELRRNGDTVTITRRTTAPDTDMKLDEFTAVCGDNCLMDMTPAALPMSVMTRRYDTKKGGDQAFKWVGVSLTNDLVLLDGTATISVNKKLKVKGIPETDVTHWRFVEELKDPASGQAYQMHAHLWTDTKEGLRKFGMGRTPKPSTIGIRQSDEAYNAQMPVE